MSSHAPGAPSWHGPVRRYDILKEATIALVVVVFLTVLLAVLFSSPDLPPVTIRAWASAQPKGFTEIALSELEGTSASATYGPPYNTGSGSVQSLGPISFQRFVGVRYPLDPATSFVLDPLRTIPGQPALTRALNRFEAAPKAERARWETAFGQALSHARVENGRLVVPKGRYGPVGTMLTELLSMARSGALDAQLIAHASFYTTDYTRPIMFIGDSFSAQQDQSYWGRIVAAEHLAGSQWGEMNETGSWPGQPWLWLYTMWYQVPPMSTSGNADILVAAIMAVLSLALLLVPFIPGIRDLPRLIPLHRLVWRDYYRGRTDASPDAGAGPSRAPARS